MKQEDKELLLNVLCAMLPYKPMVNADDGLSIEGEGSDYTLLGVNANRRIVLLGLAFEDAYATHREHLENIKPYLRPMESMTEAERLQYNSTRYSESIYDADLGGYVEEKYYDTFETLDFLNANHFDHSGLIPKGLALEAPKDMYN